jgi:1,4-dihydroxy-2-naphthoyl-CoA hydrolase
VPPLDTSDFTRSRGFDALYGLEILELTAELVVGRFEVRPALLQPFGLLHGGVYAAAAESLASHGAGFAALQEGKIAVGMSNLTSFLRPATEGTISVRATRRHHGRTSAVWDVDSTDAAGRLCATSRVTIAIREPPAGVDLTPVG